MSNDPVQNGAADGANPASSDPREVEVLKAEVSRLREQLASATAEAAEYRRAAYAMLNKLVPYTRPTDEELHELMHGPRGQSLLSVIEEYERRQNG